MGSLEVFSAFVIASRGKFGLKPFGLKPNLSRKKSFSFENIYVNKNFINDLNFKDKYNKTFVKRTKPSQPTANRRRVPHLKI